MITSNFNEKADKIEKDIANNLSKIKNFVEDDTPTSWTNAVNEILYNTAKENGRSYFTASKLKKCEHGEWLYDFLWYDNNEFGLNDISLVVESEWKNPWGNFDYCSDIQHDFEKLILAKSMYRLMIFEGNNIEENSIYINTLIKVVQNCKLTKNGDRYMFATWNIEAQEFYFYLFVA